MQQIAESKGGKCLSKEYVNSLTKLEWECKEGHVFLSTPTKIKRKYWCPECSLNKKGSIEKMQKIAQSRGGKCLSQKYINSLTKLEWECKEGHRWEALPLNINQGTWCIICAIVQRTERNKKSYFENLKQNAKSKGGKCLSKEYVNSLSKLEWECAKGHK